MLEAMKRRFENFGVESLEFKWPKGSEHSDCQHAVPKMEERTGGEEEEASEEQMSESSSTSSSTESFEEIGDDPPIRPPERRQSEDKTSVKCQQQSSEVQLLKAKQEALLRDLHVQIDDLREKNRELQYRLVMMDNESPSSRPPSSTGSTEERLRSNLADLEEELQRVKSENEVLVKLLDEGRALEDLKGRGHLNSLPRLGAPRGLLQPLEAASQSVSSKSLESLKRIESLYCKRLQEADEVIFFLQKENQDQRKELMDMKAEAFKTCRLKYRGCNHPTRLRSGLKPSLDESSLGSLRRSKRTRTGSLDRFPTLPPFKPRTRSSIRSELLPPVPGSSSGSDTSSSNFSSRAGPLNLISLRNESSHRPHSEWEDGPSKKKLLPHVSKAKKSTGAKTKSKSSVMKP